MDQLDSLPNNRKDAKLLKSVSYFTGSPCKNHHIDKRYTKTGVCYACKRSNNKIDRQRHVDRYIKINKRSYYKHRNKKIQSSKKWAKNNPEKVKLIKLKNKLKHKEKYKQTNKEYSKKKRKCPQYRLLRSISKRVWEIFKKQNKTKKNSYINEVDWTSEKLIQHIEKQFDKNMIWDNYGTYWHLDHIIPVNLSLKSSIPFSTSFIWDLENLRPLERKTNISRSKLGDPVEMIEVCEKILQQHQQELKRIIDKLSSRKERGTLQGSGDNR